MNILYPLLAALAGLAANNDNASHRLAPVPVRQVQVDDEFWSPKRKVWQQTTIDDCFKKFDNHGDGAMSNFDRVRDGLSGGHAGPQWYDGLLYEMIRGAADFLAATPDAELEKRIDGYIDRIVAAQAKDLNGYVNTWTQLMAPSTRWGSNGGNDVDQHDVYNFGALVEAGVHYHQATGKTKLLAAAVKMANHACDVIGPPPKANVIPGHALAEEALADLYLLFRANPELKKNLPVPVDEARYLKLAEFWIENRGNHEGRRNFGAYDQDEKPVFQQETLDGHAVRATLMCAGLTALSNINGRDDYAVTALRLWHNMIDRRMHVNGGVGASREGEAFSRDYHLPNNAYLETCAAIGSGFFSRNMNLLFCDARYVDELERILYNAALAGVSLQGDTYFYENPLEASRDRRRWSWHPCPCCPPMFLKLMGAMPGYIYAQTPDALYVNLFVSSRAEIGTPDSLLKKATGSGLRPDRRSPDRPRAEIGLKNGTGSEQITADSAENASQQRTSPLFHHGKITLRQTTRYPWDSAVKLSVDPAEPAEFDLFIRVPSWCQGESSPDDLYRIVGRPARGAATFKLNGQPIDAPEIVHGYARLHRRWQAGDEIELTLDMPARRVRANPKVEADAGRVALLRGPLIYCVESLDNPADLRTLALPSDAELAAEHRPNLLGGITILRAPAVTLPKEKDETQTPKPTTLLAIPYYANCNRDPSDMLVWLKEMTDATHLPQMKKTHADEPAK
jgi:DUF1680 family protein